MLIKIVYVIFSYMMTIIMENLIKKYMKNLLKFKPEKIEGLGVFPEKKLNQIKKI